MPDLFSRLAERIEPEAPVMRPPDRPWSEGPSTLLQSIDTAPPVQHVQRTMRHDPETLPLPGAVPATVAARSRESDRRIEDAADPDGHALLVRDAPSRSRAAELETTLRRETAEPAPAPTLGKVLSLLNAGAPVVGSADSDEHGDDSGAEQQPLHESTSPAAVTVTIGDIIVRPRAVAAAVLTGTAPGGSVSLADYLAGRR